MTVSYSKLWISTICQLISEIYHAVINLIKHLQMQNHLQINSSKFKFPPSKIYLPPLPPFVCNLRHKLPRSVAHTHVSFYCPISPSSVAHLSFRVTSVLDVGDQFPLGDVLTTSRVPFSILVSPVVRSSHLWWADDLIQFVGPFSFRFFRNVMTTFGSLWKAKFGQLSLSDGGRSEINGRFIFPFLLRNWNFQKCYPSSFFDRGGLSAYFRWPLRLIANGSIRTTRRGGMLK